jgi:hypothetical protein
LLQQEVLVALEVALVHRALVVQVQLVVQLVQAVPVALVGHRMQVVLSDSSVV